MIPTYYKCSDNFQTHPYFGQFLDRDMPNFSDMGQTLDFSDLAQLLLMFYCCVFLVGQPIAWGLVVPRWLPI